MDDLVEAVGRVADDTGFSGVVRFDHQGETFAAAYGLAHRGFRIPNTTETQFGIASGGKTFTALAVIGLIVESKISLDTPVRPVLGADLPLIDEAVTVEHLLAHRSGIGDYLDEGDSDLDLSDYLLISPVQNLDRTEAFLVDLHGRPTKFPPGERFSYCNSGYMVLALVAERVSGIPYHDLVLERVVARAGLKDTSFLRSDEPSGRMALGYLDSEGLRTNVFHLPVRGNGDGGIYTTAADVHRFWNSFFDAKLVPADWVAEMTRPRTVVPEENARYGLGFWLASSGPNVRLIGADTGVSFFSEHDPTTRSTWTVISNTTDGAWPLVARVRESIAG